MNYMKWNPFLNAVTASAYIGAVTLLMQVIQSHRYDTPDTLLDGMGFISLIVLSVAVMAFLFFYQPVRMLIENKAADAVAFFLKTVGIFAVVTITVLAIVIMQ